MKTKFGIVGCGFLGNIVADAWKNGLLPDYELVGVTSRTRASAEKTAETVAVPCVTMWMPCWRWSRSTSWRPLRWRLCAPCCACAKKRCEPGHYFHWCLCGP